MMTQTRRARSVRLLTALILLAVLLLASCSRERAAVTPTPDAPTPAQDAPAPMPDVPTPEPVDTDAIFAAELRKVRTLMEAGRCYEAFREIVALEETYRGESERLQACEALFAELDQMLRALEPASGTELQRSFDIQGGCVLEVNAFSGPVLVTVTDEYAVLEGNPNPGTVTFYVRQGEVGQTSLPAGTYRIRYQVGLRWFGEADGFGEYRSDGELDPLVFDFYMDGPWASNSKYTITI